MRKSTRRAALCCVAACVVPAASYAQGGRAGWPTTGGDAQRTSWVRTDARISKDAIEKGAFRLLWKAKLDNQSTELESLTQPLLLPNIISYKGFKALAFTGGSADNVYALDYDLNKIFWKVHLASAAASAKPTRTPACPVALTTITRATPLPAPPVGTGGERGRGGPPGAPGAGRGGGGGGRGGDSNIYAISSAGVLHTLNPQTGEDFAPPIKFLPPNARAAGAVLIDRTVYVATTGNCGGAPNGVWAVDLASDEKAVARWETPSAIAGTAGPAFGADGTVYVATGEGDPSYSNAVVALDPRTLKVKDAFIAESPFVSSPIVIHGASGDLVTAANKDGRIYLLAAASLGGPDRKTPLARSAGDAHGAGDAGVSLATWESSDGTRWILMSSGAVRAFRIGGSNSAPSIETAWTTRDLAAPLTPLVVNGVVFALADGEYRSADAAMTARDRAKRSKPAVLYALDAVTGKELWTSGSTITSFVHAVAPSGGDGQVYVVTYDGTVYAFGVPLEH